MADEPPQLPAHPDENKNPIVRSESAYNKLRLKANTAASIATLFIFLLAFGGAFGYLLSASRKPAAKTSSTQTVETLTPSQINQLSQVGSTLGSTNQTLNIGANTLFRGNENVMGTLSVGGQFNANGPVSLSQLDITGNTQLAGLSVGSNLTVIGTTDLKGALTVANQATFTSNVTVAGNASVGNLGADSIAVHNLNISGPLLISHLVTQGPTPEITGRNLAGGSVNISGNDTSGQININTGGNNGQSLSGLVATVTYRSPFSGNTHVQLTAENAAAATAGVYASPSSTGFTVGVAAAGNGQTLSYSYLVTQ